MNEASQQDKHRILEQMKKNNNWKQIIQSKLIEEQ